MQGGDLQRTTNDWRAGGEILELRKLLAARSALMLIDGAIVVT